MAEQGYDSAFFDGTAAMETSGDDEPPTQRRPFTGERSGIVRAPHHAISRPLADDAWDRARDEKLETGFVAEQQLADLLFRRRVRRIGPGVIAYDGRGYYIREAVKIIGRADGHSDPYGLTGAVESLADLVRAGGQVSGPLMRLGSATYHVERGVIALAQSPEVETNPVIELLDIG